MTVQPQQSESAVDDRIERRMLLAYSQVGSPIVLVYALTAVLFFHEHMLDLIAATGLAVTFAFAYLLARGRIPRWTRVAIPATLCAVFAVLARLDGGVGSVVYTILPAFVLMMRFLVGARLATVFALVSMAWATVMAAFPSLVPLSDAPRLPQFMSLSRVVIITLSNLFTLWFAGIPAGMLRRTLEQTRNLAADLENRVVARTKSLEEAQTALKTSHDQLERTNAGLESFARSLTHDLRAPLRTIAGFTGMVLEDDGERLTTASIAHLGRVNDATRRMDDLIEAILELSRSSFAPLRRERVDLASLARDILESWIRESPERSVEVRLPENASCLGDPVLLRTVMENLLSNAWKFTGNTRGARIEFLVESTAQGDVFAVRDNGAGFAKEQSAKLFQHFARLHDSREFNGSGIGLANARRILERHQGWIGAEGETGRGATFRFWLPSSPAEAPLAM